MKILLLNVINNTHKVEEVFDNLGLAYLSSCLKKEIKNIRVSFSHIGNTKIAEEKIEKFKPDIIGLSVTSQNYDIAIEIAKFCKKRNRDIIIGGTHISAVPESLDKSMKIGVLKEGEVTMVELVKLYQEKGKFDNEDLKLIKGIIFWEDDKLFKTKERPLIENLDDIPFPDRTIINVDPNSAMIISSRGCPYNCSFCASKTFWKTVRFNSADYVIKEIEELINKHNAKRIFFCDDLFIAHRPRLNEIAKQIIEKGINKKVEFILQCRANLVNDDLCKILKSMNVKDIMIGIESGSPTVLKFLKGNDVTVEQNDNAINILKRWGFNVVGFFIIATPVDTKETLNETYQFIKKSKLDDFAIFFLIPYPGTPIWELAKSKGLVSNNMDWGKLRFGSFITAKERKLSDFNKGLIMSCINKKILFKFYKKIYQQKKIRRAKFLLKLGLKNPSRILPFVIKNIKWSLKYQD